MAKIEYTIKTTLDDGTVIERNYSHDCELNGPDQIDRNTLKGLLDDVDRYERAMVHTRKEVEKEFTDAIFNYKKNSNVKKSCSRK